MAFDFNSFSRACAALRTGRSPASRPRHGCLRHIRPQDRLHRQAAVMTVPVTKRLRFASLQIGAAGPPSVRLRGPESGSDSESESAAHWQAPPRLAPRASLSATRTVTAAAGGPRPSLSAESGCRCSVHDLQKLAVRARPGEAQRQTRTYVALFNLSETCLPVPNLNSRTAAGDAEQAVLKTAASWGQQNPHCRSDWQAARGWVQPASDLIQL
jgi:hypothetical protein